MAIPPVAMDIINLDHNATTAVLPDVWEAMRPLMVAAGNPASSHRLGRRVRQALEEARESLAQLLDAQPDEVLFTSGATEANNLALFGLAGEPPPGHPPATIVSSGIEHPCVTEPIQQLVRRGHRYVSLPVDARGVVQPLPEGWPLGTRLVAVMLANHETGAVQPVRELAAALPESVAFHCDAAAAVGKMDVSFRSLGVASLSLSAHKFHGPKGIGALIVRKQAKLQPQLFGGHQQHGKRPGTEPVALAVGMATALRLALRDLDRQRRHLLGLRQRLLDLLRAEAEPVVLNGPETGGLPHTLNLSFPGCAADALLMNLDLAGVACSTGSACSSGSLLPSPVLRAMNVPAQVLGSAMRFSLGNATTEAEIDEAGRRILKSVRKLRASE
ncbi:MAG: cysteine desulfurase [Gemmataceae bacterium]|nr:cysteine desulfurase [Gemmataceae bacterium]